MSDQSKDWYAAGIITGMVLYTVLWSVINGLGING